MELEKWLLKYNIKDMAINDLKHYLKIYKEEEEEDYRELFEGKLLDDICFIFYSVSYVINEEWNNEGAYKYILATVELEYHDTRFAEYTAIYDLDGNPIDDYLLAL